MFGGKICSRVLLCDVSVSHSIATSFQARLQLRSPGLGGSELLSARRERAVGGCEALFSLRREADSVRRFLLLLEKMTDLRSKLLTSGKSVLNTIIKV